MIRFLKKELGLKKYFFAAAFCLIILSPLMSHAGPVESRPDTVSTKALKQYMSKFGALVAGLEILRTKEPKPDWAVIGISLKEMDTNLQQMLKTDKTGAYKNYTDALTEQMAELKKMNEKKDKRIYDGIDKLTDTCFKCHAAHRPGDFLNPKADQKLSESQKSK